MFKDKEEFFREILSDTLTAIDVLHEDRTSSFNRRMFVRAIFAGAEGITHLLKTWSLGFANENPGQYTIGEIALLREESYELDRTGTKVKSRSKFVPTAKNFRFAVVSFMKFDPDFKFDSGGQGWESFKEALAIRNRITHPKKVSDLQIDDDELDTCIDAHQWLIHSSFACLIDYMKHLYKHSASAGIRREMPDQLRELERSLSRLRNSDQSS
ncbi:hypothetical protein ACERK3_19565 [Phycisphaerales bacterium AB-hyl4]|uniref:Apea-like HEPN domain-containing protein n=1 Tax=Natronomicrosphaera hydrolytica TaxID=3242702 RepID=A0ABV4UA77_9BACT